MKNTYRDLINQSFTFPNEEFDLRSGTLYFHGLNLRELLDTYGTPLKLYYLPSIRTQVEKARRLFDLAIRSLGYPGSYTYAYCTKASHFSFVLDEVLAANVVLETSSANDLTLVELLHESGKINKTKLLIHNGFKPVSYLNDILRLYRSGYNTLPVLDNVEELNYYKNQLAADEKLNIGIRVATEEEPRFEFYTSRLGIRPNLINYLYTNQIVDDPRLCLKMLHFFVDTGIQDTSYYWNELRKAVRSYALLRQQCTSLTAINIGGGLPIRHGLGDDYDYTYLIREIVRQIQDTCRREGVPCPDIYSEFGTFTVGESGATFFEVIGQKQQNDSELWYMVDGSIMNALPDTWGLSERFILLPIDHWEGEPVRVNIGGLTCDNSDFYNSERHGAQLYLPKFNAQQDRLRLGFFNTGAYQDALAGRGGIQHCLIPGIKRVLVDINPAGELHHWLDAPTQNSWEMLSHLGYKKIAHPTRV